MKSSLKAVSHTVWVLIWNAVTTEKPIKEKWMDKNYSNDNYNLVYSDTIDNYNYIAPA